MKGRWLPGPLVAVALLVPFGAPSAEAGCTRPASVYFYDSGQNTSVDIAPAARSVVFTTSDGRELRADNATVVDDGRRLTVTANQPDLKITVRADLAYGRVRALATEIKPLPTPTKSRVAIRSRHRVKNWTIVSYGGPSQEGECGSGGGQSARTRAGRP